MADLPSDWLILLWPPVIPLTWIIIVRGHAHLLAYRSSTARWNEFPAREMSASMTFARGEGDEDEWRNASRHPPEAGRARRLPSAKPARTWSTIRDRYGPRSLRGQITFLATVLTAVVAVVTHLTAGVGAYLAAPHPSPAVQGASAVATPPHDHGRPARPREQHAADRRTPVYAARPAPTSRPFTVEASQPFRGPTSPVPLQLIMALETVGLTALSAWATWKVTGRLLSPLKTVHAELTVINPRDRPARVSEPGNAHEITRLCRTINNVLGHLHKDRNELEELAHRQWQFASDVSHELRNPIAGLMTQLEVAQQDPGHARWPELLRTTLNQVERLQTITDDMLCLARMRTSTPGELRRLDLAALVQAEVSRRADRLPVRLHLTHGTTVTAVPSQIGRLLANLLDNAQRHSTHLVDVEVRPADAAVELTVSDDGPGIAVGDRERIFHRFTRLDDGRRLDRNGTGLGLAIARDIAQAHHGSLRVEESAAGGARLVLRLPQARPRETESS
jgi:signal transduction histidine kinase